MQPGMIKRRSNLSENTQFVVFGVLLVDLNGFTCRFDASVDQTNGTSLRPI